MAPSSDRARSAEAASAFPVASRGGDFDALLARNLSRTTTTEGDAQSERLTRAAAPDR